MKRSTHWIRLGLSLVGAILLGDAVALSGMGLFNFGIVLPGSIGIAFLLLGLCWNGVARWRKADRRRLVLWRAGWIAFANTFLSGASPVCSFGTAQMPP
ncbi:MULTISPECIES: hypothetical protein [unclassified Cupriavidus]|uniref:hypothetical protein n=1 Tax=unclassified Cupriavidus TaxID=2640874 RepID=UPI00048FF75C|nr:MULTISPECIES: hypothetical protein [unclassified Cupriavidus]MBP0629927.1 hypothetical protein [Cupriavidus sp. AcVe19-1a]MBP0637268.1 hypothetical protein [Cupriavidus sp. AcVe19-6a]